MKEKTKTEKGGREGEEKEEGGNKEEGENRKLGDNSQEEGNIAATNTAEVAENDVDENATQN